MKSQHAISNLVMVATAAGLLMMSFTANADLDIQSAQFNAQKGVLFVKGKFTDTSATQVHVIDAQSGRFIASVDAKGKQFRDDIPISEATVPCIVQIQTNMPSRRAQTNAGEFDVAEVRHAPDRCSE